MELLMIYELEYFTVKQDKNDFSQRFKLYPNDKYFSIYGNDTLKAVCPKYSFGELSAFAVIEVKYNSNNTLTIIYFDNYVRRYISHTNCKVNQIHYGLGTLLLYVVINSIKKLFNINFNIEIESYIQNIKRDIYFESLSFEINKNNFGKYVTCKTTCNNLLDKLNKRIYTFNFNNALTAYYYQKYLQTILPTDIANMIVNKNLSKNESIILNQLLIKH